MSTKANTKTAAAKATKAQQSTPADVVEVKPQPTTGPKSGKVTNRRPSPKDQGHTLVRLVGPYATKGGKHEVTWACECGKSARPYVKDADDLATARGAHQRHADKALARP